MQQIRNILLSRRSRIDGTDRVRDVESMENLSQQAEIIDIAQAFEQIDREKSLAEQERRELIAIERALAKLGTGSFGVCEECDEEIPSRRLMVLPEARLCAKCQAFEERQLGRIRGGSLRGEVA